MWIRISSLENDFSKIKKIKGKLCGPKQNLPDYCFLQAKSVSLFRLLQKKTGPPLIKAKPNALLIFTIAVLVLLVRV